MLATAQERRVSVLPDMAQILQLEDWHHPNVVDNADRPTGSETFQQLAQVLTTGEVATYHPHNRRIRIGETGLTEGICSSENR